MIPALAVRHRGDTRDPRRLQGAEFRPDDDLTVRSELDPGRPPSVCMDIGIDWTSVSVPNAGQGSGRIACRHRAIPDLPELEPPLSTITWMATAPRYLPVCAQAL